MTSFNENKLVWLITGCSTGFGQEISRAALERGHAVVLTARQPSTLDELHGKFPDTSIAVKLDVTSNAMITEAFDAALKAFGRIDVVVNNAGYGILGAVEELGPEFYKDQFEVNLFGLFEVCRTSLALMRRQKHGHIINISSAGGLVARPGLGYYHASKFAVEGFSEAMSQEVAPLGIKVSLIEPGNFRTAWNKNAQSGLDARVERIAEYRQTCQPVYDMLNIFNGDAEKAAQIIVDLAENPAPPLRLPLGSGAVARIRQKFSKVLSELDRLEAISTSADLETPA